MEHKILLLGASTKRRPLETVREEVKKIKSIFQSAADVALGVEYEPNLERKDLMDLLRLQTNQLTMIHFAGHSGEQQLEADDGLVYSHHIANILKTWTTKPDLIFLNGCNSSGQVRDFLQAGVKCIIATHNYIDDRLASDFAQEFYRNLLIDAGNVNLYAAFQRAGSTALSGELRRPRSLDIDREKNLPQKLPEFWDWGIFAAFPEFSKHWSLQHRQVLQPLSWASQTGKDEYGIYAELEIKGVVQRFRQITANNTTNSFWLADTACTQALWQTVMTKNPAEFRDDPQKPVERVSWVEVQRFLEKLNQQFAGLNARLPTEAEWELACRANSEAAYAFDSNIDKDQVNFGARGTVPVKSLPANTQGLYEMHGNVWEWCADHTDRWGNLKVLRGGSWANTVEEGCSDTRGQSASGNRDYTIGFRILNT